MTKKTFYNEYESYPAQWIRNLIEADHLPAGDVSEVDIRDLSADDLDEYTQAHFFAGIGGWPLALRMAGWTDDMPAWTGSCPCQPFSCAGQQKGNDDARNLWPVWSVLIEKCKPPIIFGEQVASKLARQEWLPRVSADLEGMGYTVAAADLPAASVGAPHVRSRLWWVAVSDKSGWMPRVNSLLSGQPYPERSRGQRLADTEGGPGNIHIRQRQPSKEKAYPERGGQSGGMVNTENPDGGRSDGSNNGRRRSPEAGGSCVACGLGIPQEQGLERHSGYETVGQKPRRVHQGPNRSDINPGHSCWSDAEYIPCADGKYRRIKPGIAPLADGVSNRVGRLRAYGNAIVPQVAATFIVSAIEAIQNIESGRT